MRMDKWLIAGAVLVFAAQTAQAQDAQSGGSRWIISENAAGCVAVGTTSSNPPTQMEFYRSYHKSALSLFIDHAGSIPYDYGVTFDMRLAGETAPIASGRALPLGSVKSPRTTFSITANDAGQQRLERGLSNGTVLVFSANDEEITRITIDNDGFDSAEFDACYARVGETLMAARPDGESEDAPARGPLAKNAMTSWIRTGDYRSTWLRNDYQGVVRYALQVSKYGFVDECIVTQSSGYADMDDRTCLLLDRRARFYPARDDGQQAIAGDFIGAVRWVIPN